MIYNLPQDMPSADVYRHFNWNTIDYRYKLRLIKLFNKFFNGEALEVLNYLVNNVQLLQSIQPQKEEQCYGAMF